MRVLRMLLMALSAVAVALAFGASSAAAEVTGVELWEETPTQEEAHHCPPVVLDVHVPTGGCVVHATTTTQMTLFNHVQEPGDEHIALICDNEFELRLDENGHGYIYNQILSGANCGLAPCDEAAPSHANFPWEVQIREPRGSEGVEILRMTFCLRPLTTQEGAAGTTCTMDVLITDLGSHEYELSALPESPCINLGGAVELSGAWALEDTGIEIEHLDDPA